MSAVGLGSLSILACSPPRAASMVAISLPSGLRAAWSIARCLPRHRYALRRVALLRVKCAHLRRVEPAKAETIQLRVARRCFERDHHRTGVVVPHRAHPDLLGCLLLRLHLVRLLCGLGHLTSRSLLLGTRCRHHGLNHRALRLHLARCRHRLAHLRSPPERLYARGRSNPRFCLNRERRHGLVGPQGDGLAVGLGCSARVLLRAVPQALS
eukprot:scaffold88669_cov57-Phaeocystis_antarctica.AAC.1